MMKIKRYIIENSSILDRIKELITNSFFSSKSFIDLWKTKNSNGVIWVAEDNDTILAVLPGIEFGFKPFCRFQSMPDGCYGGIFTNLHITFDHDKVKKQLLKQILNYGYIKLYINDFYNSIPIVENSPHFTIQTQIIDLNKNIEIPSDKKIQSEIRKAERENIIIENFDINKHFNKFLILMNQTEKRHKRKPKYSDSFYKILADKSKYDSKIIWLWCEHNGQAVASHINIVERNQCLNWQVFYNKEFSNLKANQLMLSRLIDILKIKKINLLNLGASPEDARGLINYKTKWGSEIRTYNCYYKKSWLGKLI